MNSYTWIAILLISRYLHIVCTTLLVGGTLFYEMVVPVAIGELREEQQLLIFARARWIFKWIVWSSCILLLASGVIASITHWPQYTAANAAHVDEAATQISAFEPSPAVQPGLWWAAHAGAGVIALLIALSLTIGNTPPAHPIRWMRLNLIALLLVIFLATATRQARLQSDERHPNESPSGMRE